MPTMLPLLILALIQSSESWKGVNVGSIARKFTSAAIAASLSTFHPLAIEPVQAIPALEAAQRAMLETKTEKRADERDFASLPEGAKKRRALAACKDSDSRRSARYSSASQCSEDVLSGNYRIVFSDIAQPSISPSAKIVTATAPIEAPRQIKIELPTKSVKEETKFVAQKQPRVKEIARDIPKATTTVPTKAAAPAKITAPTETKMQKVQDLSDLSPAQKKRRALAACKKKDTRAFACMGTETKCNEMVMSGGYDSIIEALEYGR